MPTSALHNSSQSKVIGLDVGDRRIGVAASDTLRMLATPLAIIDRTRQNPYDSIIEIVKNANAAELVVGLPRNMDGSVGPQAKKVQHFAEQVRKLQPSLTIVFHDERLSTVQVRRGQLEAGTPRKKRQMPVDAASAAVILQSYLDMQRNKAET